MRTPSSRKAIAIIAVVTALVFLAMIGTPFLMSMILQKKSSQNFLNQARARLAAQGALNFATHYLASGEYNRELEQQLKNSKTPELFSTPDFDTYLELYIPLPSLEKELSKIQKPLFDENISWESSTSFDLLNQKGIFWSVTVEDEQAKVNLNSASPWVLGNLFGSTLTTEDIPANDTTLPVQSTAHFNPDGGILWVQGELISYERTSEKAFMRCRRGLQAQLPEFDLARNIPRGALIIDARAYKLSRHSYREVPEEFLSFLNIHQIKNIANYGSATLLPEEVDSLLPFLTVHSHRRFLSGWSQTNQLASRFRFKNQKKDIGSTLSLESPGKYGPGTLVRIRHPLATEYSRIRSVNGTQIFLEDRLLHDYDVEKTRIDFGDPFPVNLNTAREELLVALFFGVVFQGSNDPITQEQASEVARKLIEASHQNNFITSPQSFYDFLNALQNLQILKQEQVEALYLNATDPYGQYQGRFLEVHTAPFCYKNEDVYSIRATGLVHSPMGAQIASHTLQEIIRVAPEQLRTKIWETQKDFLEALPPESHQVVTWPNPIIDARSKGDTSRHPDKGDVRIFPSETLQADLPFSHTIEGELGTHSHGAFPIGSNSNITPGYTEFWIKSPTNAGGNYFAAIPSQIEPGISVDQILLDSGKELLLRLYDPCLGNNYAGIRFPYQLGKRIWYHLSLSWWTLLVPGQYYSRFGALSLFLDGVPVGEFDYFDASGRSLTTELTSAVPDIQANEIQVTSTQGFPPRGAILIGEEVIEYESKTATSFKVWGFDPKKIPFPGFDGINLRLGLNPIGRAARTSKSQIFPMQGIITAKDFAQLLGINVNLLGVSSTWDGFSHEQGSVVLPFGYSNRLDGTNLKIADSNTVVSVGTFDFSKIYLGQGTLKDSIKATPTPPAITLSAVQAGDTSISVVSTKDFPPSGYILIGSELIFYASRASQSFDGLKRAQGGTQATIYQPNMAVHLNSIQLSNAQNYPENGWCQIDFEWFGPYTKMGNYLVGLLLEDAQGQRIAGPLYRGGAYGLTEHKLGTKVIPVFAVQTAACGAGDDVTIIDNHTDPTQRYRQQIVYTRPFQSSAFQGQNGNGKAKCYFLLALNDWLPREILASEAGRVLKFPSGELPAQALQGVYGAPDPKIYDEIKVRTSTPTGFYLLHPMSPKATHFVSFVPIEPGRLIKIGNEIMTAQKVENLGSQGNLPFPAFLIGPLIRGAFNTPVDPHPNGSPYLILDYIPSSVLNNSLSSTSSRAELFPNASVFPAQGYLRMGKEVFGYTEKNGFTFSMPRKDKTGLFRRRFGTPKSSHAVGDLATFQPYRYWDHFAVESGSREINHYTLVFSSQNTLFQGLRWEESLHRNRRLDVVCLARFNGSPDWNAVPTNKKGGLFLLESGGTHHSFGNQGIQANQIELRFLFRYHSGAFLSDIWKETPWLKKIELEYYAPTQILQAEELRE